MHAGSQVLLATHSPLLAALPGALVYELADDGCTQREWSELDLVQDWRAFLDDPVISVRVDDIDAAYTQARERGYEIVHPLTTEEWGVTRFFVRAPDGNILNVVQHRD